MAVDLAAGSALAQPVTLKQIKADALLKHCELTRNPRLSVMGFEKREFDEVLRLGAG